MTITSQRHERVDCAYSHRGFQSQEGAERAKPEDRRVSVGSDTRADFILPLVQGPDVLDLGCGAHVPEPGAPYWLHGRLREKFPAVVGVDLNRESVEKLRALGFDNLHVGNAEDIRLDCRFNTIVAGELIEHLSNPGLFLESAQAHLAPGGQIILTTPYVFCLLGFVYAFFKYPNTCQNPEHTIYFCPASLQELASRAHLKVVHWELIGIYGSHDPSPMYRLFVRLIRMFKWSLPKRLWCNAMLFVLA